MTRTPESRAHAYRRALEAEPGDELLVRRSYAIVAGALTSRNDPATRSERCRQALSLFERELICVLADVHDAMRPLRRLPRAELNYIVYLADVIATLEAMPMRGRRQDAAAIATWDAALRFAIRKHAR